MKNKVSAILEGLCKVDEASKLDNMLKNKKRYEYVMQNAKKLVKNDIDLDITVNLILRWVKGKNWEGGLGSGADIQKMYKNLSKMHKISDDEVYSRLENLIEFWTNEFKKAGI